MAGIGIDSAGKIRDFAKTYKIKLPTSVADVGGIELPRELGNRAPALRICSHVGAVKGANLRKVLESFRR